MTVRRQHIIRGDVQGVGFRGFAQQKARGLGLVGFVRNILGGDVEVIAQGDAEALRKFEAALSEGPPFSSVSDVQRHDLPPQDDLLDFVIQR